MTIVPTFFLFIAYFRELVSFYENYIMGDEREYLKERKFGWTIGIDNDCSYVWDCGLKDFSSIKCNEEEIAFIKKWGLHTAKSTLPIWICTDNSRKAEYYELEENYSLFSELLTDHYEDLKLYALMYRNVPFYNVSNDALSILYFVSKKDEIIGFKEKLQKENSLKAQIAFLCYANEVLFPMLSVKYANVNFQHNRIASEFKIDTVRNFKSRKITKVLSVDDFSDEICAKILANKHEISFYNLVQVKVKNFGNIYKYITHEPNKEYPDTHKLKNRRYYVLFRKDELIKKWCNVIDEEFKRLEKIEQEKREEEERELRLRREREEKQRRREEEARRVKFEYNKKNKHFRDSDLSFDESTHLYKVDGVILQSVTNFVKGCFPKFEAEYHAKRKAEQLGIALEEVLEMWERKGEESRELGTELHKRIENYYQGIISNVDDKTFNLFKMFADKVELKPYRTEWAVYDVKHNIAGTIDFVDYQNGEYIIYDWKRSDKIIENGMPIKISKYDEKGNHPLEHLDNTPYYHYALQMSIYKFILENNYNIKISDLRLGIFHPAYNKPYVLRIPYLEKEINDLFNLRSEVLF